MTDQALSNSLAGPPDNAPPGPSLTGPPPAGAGHLERPARVLLGWLPPERGEFILVANQAGVELTDQQRARVRQARAAVAARLIGVDQTDLVSALPPELAGHLARLQPTPAGARMFQEGWDVAMVDLERVIAFQPLVFTDTAVERVADVAPDDLEAIAELTLPIDHTAPVIAQYEELKHTYTFTSPDPNLKVLGIYNGPVPEANGAHGFGFLVGVAPSFLQVARFQDRHVLRDGYHRTFGLLSRGISSVPAFIRDFDTLENLAPAGMLPQSAWLGQRPPLLSDYHNDLVSESVRWPAQRKMVIVQALELSPQG